MYKGKKIIAIIPARGGSKGLPLKNILPFDNLPLIAHTIQAAKKCHLIDKIIVSTDSLEIKEVSLNYGADVPFLRPANLASDQAGTIDVLSHALEFLNNLQEDFDIILLLQPTSPLRNTSHITNALNLYFEHSQSEPCTVVSASKMERKYNWLLKENENGTISFFKENSVVPRQELKDVYMPNGAIYICQASELKNGFYTKNTYPYIMDKELSIDIDTKEDFDNALSVYLKNKNE